MTNFQLKPQMINFIKHNSQWLEDEEFVKFIRAAYNTLPFNQFKDDLPVVLYMLGVDLDKEFTQAAAEVIALEDLPTLKSASSDNLLSGISIGYWKETTAEHVLTYLVDHQAELKIKCVKLDAEGFLTHEMYNVRSL